MKQLNKYEIEYKYDNCFLSFRYVPAIQCDIMNNVIFLHDMAFLCKDQYLMIAGEN